MKSEYIYHSPLGNRTLIANAAPKDGKVDLHNGDGVLEIGSCKIGLGEGQCARVGDEDSDGDGDELKGLGIKELRERAESLGIDHTDKKKAELIELIHAAEKPTE